MDTATRPDPADLARRLEAHLLIARRIRRS
jgi:hypothetical protein